MKYNIHINQYAVVANKLNLDFNDLAIYDFIKDFGQRNECVKMNTDEGQYMWISHKLVIENLPLLGIKTSGGIIKRIDKLVTAGLLVKHPQSSTLGKTMYRFGPNFGLLEFGETPIQKSTPLYESETPIQKVEPLYENIDPPIQNYRGTPIQKFRDNIYNKKDNTITNIYREPSKKTNFRESEIGRSVQGADYSAFEAHYQGDEYNDIDLVYYYHCVADWSDVKDVKRTNRGWIATVRNFIRIDIEKNKVKRKSQGFDYAGAMEYLNGYD